MSDALRDLESRMTKEQVEYACDIVRGAGWRYGDSIPSYVWGMAFNQAIRERPQETTPSPMPVSEGRPGP